MECKRMRPYLQNKMNKIIKEELESIKCKYKNTNLLLYIKLNKLP